MSQLFVSFGYSAEFGNGIGSHVYAMSMPSTEQQTRELNTVLRLEYGADVIITNYDSLPDADHHPAARGVFGYHVGTLIRTHSGLHVGQKALLMREPLLTVDQLRKGEALLRGRIPEALSLNLMSVKPLVPSEEEVQSFFDSLP